MGQRHQIFVKIINPTKYLKTKDPNETKKLIEQFGTGEFSILTYHNQWLYGRSALQNAINLLQFGSQFNRDEKTTDKGWSGYDTPLSPKGIENKFNTLEKLTEVIGFVMNFRAVKTDWLEAGFGGSWYIGNEGEGINFDFTRGDNNDGITIIDLVENKYCFMNPFDQRTGKLGHSASDLPKMKPVSAKDYVMAYYGETVDTLNPYYIKQGAGAEKPQTPQQVVDRQIEVNKKAYELFGRFEVLTMGEIRKMFGRMKQLSVKAKTEKAGKERKQHGEKITLFKKK